MVWTNRPAVYDIAAAGERCAEVVEKGSIKTPNRRCAVHAATPGQQCQVPPKSDVLFKKDQKQIDDHANGDDYGDDG
jgi:hypothetical protein